MRFLIQLAVNAAALYAATRFVSGISYVGEPLGLAVVALVFAVVNSIIKPLVQVLALPVIFLTLGLFLLVINSLMLLLTARLSESLGFGFSVSGFGAAFVGALVVSIVSMLLNAVLGDSAKA
jgi:putative membrane protein